MSDHASLSAVSILAVVLALILTGCAQPGTQAPRSEAAKLAVGTGDISSACGYLEERTAFARAPAQSRAALDAMAQTGARKLAAVYARDQTDIYQGESIGALLGDSISLLHDCGLRGAERTLERALSRHG